MVLEYCITVQYRLHLRTFQIQRENEISTTQSTIPVASTELNSSENFAERIEEAVQNAEAVEVSIFILI